MGTSPAAPFFSTVFLSIHYQYSIDFKHNSPSQKHGEINRMVEHGAVVLMESTLSTSWHLSTPWTLEWTEHLLFIMCWPWCKVFLMSAFFGISGHQFNLFSRSVFVGKPWKAPKTNVPWPRVAILWGGIVIPSCSFVECWPQPWLFQCDHLHWEWNCRLYRHADALGVRATGNSWFETSDVDWCFGFTLTWKLPLHLEHNQQQILVDCL